MAVNRRCAPATRFPDVHAVAFAVESRVLPTILGQDLRTYRRSLILVFLADYSGFDAGVSHVADLRLSSRRSCTSFVLCSQYVLFAALKSFTFLGLSIGVHRFGS
jgi:hypothetical protein